MLENLVLVGWSTPVHHLRDLLVFSIMLTVDLWDLIYSCSTVVQELSKFR